MRPDGTILQQPGYDPTTRLLLVNPPQMKPIPDEPSEDQARAALDLLEGLLTEFPLVDDVAKSVALSTLITPVVRGAFPSTPMHIADAPVAPPKKMDSAPTRSLAFSVSNALFNF
jgi:putative DNA primase/helicase